MRDDEGDSGFKYAALVFNGSWGPREPHPMFGVKETIAATLPSLLPEGELRHWREWFGTVAWDDLESADRLVVVRAPAGHRDVLDDDDQRLRGLLSPTWTALLLSGEAPHGRAWIVTGKTAGTSAGSPLLSVRSVSQIDPVVRPVYEGHDTHLKLKTKEFMAHWAKHGRRDESWFWRWLEADELLGRRAPPMSLRLALLAHDKAWAERFLEFSIPDFVRAAEAVLALEPGKSTKMFPVRALAVAPRLRGDKYVGRGVQGLLGELYERRSDCVHGRLAFAEMEKQGAPGQEQAAKLAYVAEMLAREALLAALHHEDPSIFEDRSALERAWTEGVFPSREWSDVERK